MKPIFGEHVKKILVTGGAGFIGSAFIRKILRNNSIKIFNLDKCGYASHENEIKDYAVKSNKEKYELVKIDLKESEKVKDVIQKIDPDLIFHFAAETHVDRSIDSPLIFIESNILGTFNLLQAGLSLFEKMNEKRKSIFKIIHISTDEVFGSLTKEGIFDETSPYSPRSPYSASKAASDHLVNAWHHTYGMPTIITNCSNNYGPWQYLEKLIPTIILKALADESIPLYGDGSNIRDWLFVDDHIDAIIKIANKGRLGDSYCIGGSEEKSNLDVANTVCELLREKYKRKEFKKLITFVEDRPGHDKRYAIDSSKIRTELGWQPKYNFSQGMEYTVSWYLNNLNWCKKMQQRKSYSSKRIGLN